ncbi:MAG: tetratricopeptide repeat protein [Planctomycetota bacterium]
MADEVVGLVDVMPTLLDLLGLAPGTRHGRSHSFGTEAPPSDRGIYSEAMLPLLNHGWSSLHALRRADDRFIRAPEPEYYDLTRDPAETKNLAGDLPAEGRAAREELDRLMRGWGDVEAVAKEEMPLDPELAQRLAALGYGRVARAGGAGEREDPKRMLRLYAKSKSAKARLDAGDAEAALEEIKIVLRGDPENADAWITAARANLRLQRWDESEQCARRAVSLSDTAYPHHLLGQLLLRARRFDEGRAELRLALDRDPGYGGAWISIGESHAMERRWDEARRSFERAREVDPSGSGAAADRAIERLDALLRGR